MTWELLDLDRRSGPRWHPIDSSWDLGSRGFGWVLYVPEGSNSSIRIVSGEQSPPTLRRSGESVTWLWHGVVSESGLARDIDVTMTLVADGTGLRADLRVDNHSDAVVDSALYPWVRGIALPADRTLSALTRDYYGAVTRPLWPNFSWNKGYYGTERPTLMTDSLVFGNPTAPFAVMLDDQEAVAASVVGPTPEIVSWMWELDPGYGDTVGDNVPLTSSGVDAELRFSAVHLLDLAPGESRDLATILLSHAIGGWQEALAAYRASRQELVAAQPQRPVPGWAAVPHTWYQVGLNTSVGDVRYRFDDLPELARQCVAAGVSALHIIGWNDGGQDRNNPSHDADPVLGGVDGLRTAIENCHALGIKVILFAKFTWADLATERYRTELAASAVRDPYGDVYRNGGYQYLTPHQLLDVNTRRLIPMCYLHEEYLRVCEEEFDKILASGADGMLFDETMHHTPALLCYATNHGHRPGVSVYSGDRGLAERLRARVPSGREFIFAGETVYEDLQPAYDVSYIRSHYTDHQPLTRYVNPSLRMMATITGFDDRNQVNQALLLGYLLCYEPRHFKGVLADIPRTVDYAREAEKLRVELGEYLWSGRYDGDAPVVTSPDIATASALWTAESGDQVCVVANYDEAREAGVWPTDSREAFTEFRTIGGPWRPVGDAITIPARSLIVLR